MNVVILFLFCIMLIGCGFLLGLGVAKLKNKKESKTEKGEKEE